MSFFSRIFGQDAQGTKRPALLQLEAKPVDAIPMVAFDLAASDERIAKRRPKEPFTAIAEAKPAYAPIIEIYERISESFCFDPLLTANVEDVTGKIAIIIGKDGTDVISAVCKNTNTTCLQKIQQFVTTLEPFLQCVRATGAFVTFKRAHLNTKVEDSDFTEPNGEVQVDHVIAEYNVLDLINVFSQWIFTEISKKKNTKPA